MGDKNLNVGIILNDFQLIFHQVQNKILTNVK